MPKKEEKFWWTKYGMPIFVFGMIIIGILSFGIEFFSEKLQECQKENGFAGSWEVNAKQNDYGNWALYIKEDSSYEKAKQFCQDYFDCQLENSVSQSEPKQERVCKDWYYDIPCEEKNLVPKDKLPKYYQKVHPLKYKLNDSIVNANCIIKDSNAICNVEGTDLNIIYSWSVNEKPMLFFVCCSCWSDDENCEAS